MNGQADEIAVYLKLDANYKITPELKAGFTWKMNPLMAGEDTTNAEGTIRINYASGPFAAGAEFVLYDILINEGNGMGLKIKPSLSYQIIDAVLKAGLSAELNIGLGDSNDTQQLDLTLPYVEFNIDPKAKMYFSYKLGYNLDASAMTKNEIQLGFQWSY
jgi:hypothetical protein